MSGGTLSLASATLADTADVNLSTGGVLNLTFTGTDSIDQLRINGLTQAPGTWGSLASAATNKTALITGSGLLNVTGSQAVYDAWAVSKSLGGAEASPAADPDSDDVSNLMEYATGMNPAVNDVVPVAATKVSNTLEFIYTKNKSATDVTYTVEWSDDLTTWSTAGVTSSLLTDGATTQQIKALVPAGTNRRFVHLKVTRP